jgi:DNA-binding transcriptional ArsR family regulator
MANYKELETLFKALGSRRRLTILYYIVNHRECTVGDIAEDIHLSIKSTSKHLALLAKAGILEREQNGMHANFSLSPTVPNVARHIIALL